MEEGKGVSVNNRESDEGTSDRNVRRKSASVRMREN